MAALSTGSGVQLVLEMISGGMLYSRRNHLDFGCLKPSQLSFRAPQMTHHLLLKQGLSENLLSAQCQKTKKIEDKYEEDDEEEEGEREGAGEWEGGGGR